MTVCVAWRTCKYYDMRAYSLCSLIATTTSIIGTLLTNYVPNKEALIYPESQIYLLYSTITGTVHWGHAVISMFQLSFSCDRSRRRASDLAYDMSYLECMLMSIRCYCVTWWHCTLRQQTGLYQVVLIHLQMVSVQISEPVMLIGIVHVVLWLPGDRSSTCSLGVTPPCMMIHSVLQCGVRPHTSPYHTSTTWRPRPLLGWLTIFCNRKQLQWRSVRQDFEYFYACNCWFVLLSDWSVLAHILLINNCLFKVYSIDWVKWWLLAACVDFPHTVWPFFSRSEHIYKQRIPDGTNEL